MPKQNQVLVHVGCCMPTTSNNNYFYYYHIMKIMIITILLLPLLYSILPNDKLHTSGNMTFVPGVFLCETFFTLVSYCVSFDMLLATVICAAFSLTPVRVLVPVQVICTGEAFKVTRTSTNTCSSVTMKILLKLWNTMNFLQKFNAMLYTAVYIKIMSYFFTICRINK